uniref:Reverse transcriptase domain-containing protein n=1 Tax=Derbesia sp. WEST4838 TaxID=1847751 RepID=A0A1C9JBC1_9CHLO|nr:hypothetical protein [Derbesia sp. WEST4838]AOP19138.1 hypothetical protein [Derbesia sp. WEST4838]
MNSTLENLPKWDSIQWKYVMEQVRNLKYRIFMAKLKGDRRRLRRLQKLMLTSRNNILLSVRRVTVENNRKAISGIDKVLIKEKSDRMELVEQLSKMRILQHQPFPIKRSKIPKSDQKTRPLGISIIMDRCIQTIVLNALEPEWEACFEANSYGFRPGRSAHDAIGRVYNVVRVKTKGRNNKSWILNAYVEGFFNNICHKDILEKLDNFPAKSLINRWLIAGYMEGDIFNKTEKGTPQGGVISPLLANIALYELEKFLNVAPDSTGRVRGTRVYVRYADDFIIICSSKTEAQTTKKQISGWLKTKGLRLTPDKIKISHIDKGFDFLGVNIRHINMKTNQKGPDKILRIYPSEKSILKLTQKLKEEWKFLRSKSIETVLHHLNPIIADWANYYRKFSSTQLFTKLDNWTFKKSWHYASRMHANKSKHWIYDKYYGNFNLNRKDRWTFGNKETGKYLKKFTWFNIRQHIMVKGYNSPCDPRLQEYWENRDKYIYKASFINLSK